MIQWAFRQGLKRGVMGGNRVWLYVFGAAAILRFARKLADNEPKVVFSQELKPGEALVIKHPGPATMEA